MMSGEYLGRERVGKLLLMFAVPMVISFVLNAVYNMVDQVFIGQGVGYLGNGATNIIFPLTQLALAFGFMFGEGTASRMNLCMGEGMQKDAAHAMAAGLAASLMMGCILTAVFLLFLEPLCRMFGATEPIMPYAVEYGFIICSGVMLSIFDAVTMSIIRADGSPRFAMMGLVMGCVINLIGDPIAIFGLGMGIKGAAWATVLGQAVNAAMNFWYLCGHTRSVRLDGMAFRSCLRSMGTVAKLGFPSFVAQVGFVVILFVQNNLMVHYGALSQYGAEIPMTALGVTMKFFTVLFCAVMGVLAGAQPIFSFNYGSRNYERVLETLKLVLIISLSIFGVATAWFQFAPESIVGIFGSGNTLYNEYSIKCLRIFLALIVMDAFELTGSTFFQAIGKPLLATVLIMLRQIGLQIPAMVLFAHVYGVEGILYSGPLDSFLVGTAAMVLLWRERQKISLAVKSRSIKI